MKPQIHTSPVAQAFLSQDECPFCLLEKDAEQKSIRFFVGASASYMEPGTRGLTNREGFCSCHMKKIYDYGNNLGNALILQTHMEDLLQELEQMKKTPPNAKKAGLFQKKTTAENTDWQRLQQRVDSCAICDQVKDSMHRQYQVFFALLDEPEFQSYVENSKGFCLHHFAQLLQAAEKQLPSKHASWFYTTVYDVMQQQMLRVKQDLDLMIAKHDYRNAALDWGNARDAVPRAMQKLAGIYPAEPPFRKE